MTVQWIGALSGFQRNRRTGDEAKTRKVQTRECAKCVKRCIDISASFLCDAAVLQWHAAVLVMLGVSRVES